MSNERSKKMADLIDKMCRKISQLTRVVYILNTKNDEHESLINAIAISYENEMSNMTNEFNFQMKKMKQHIDKLKEKKNLENKIKEINDKYNNQVKSFSTDFDGMRKEVKENLKKNRSINKALIIDDLQKKIKKFKKQREIKAETEY